MLLLLRRRADDVRTIDVRIAVVVAICLLVNNSARGDGVGDQLPHAWVEMQQHATKSASVAAAAHETSWELTWEEVAWIARDYDRSTIDALFNEFERMDKFLITKQNAELRGRVLSLSRCVIVEIADSTGRCGLIKPAVKGIVELHGGPVHADSEGPGLGSEFTVMLPVATSPAQVRLLDTMQILPRSVSCSP